MRTNLAGICENFQRTDPFAVNWNALLLDLRHHKRVLAERWSTGHQQASQYHNKTSKLRTPAKWRGAISLRQCSIHIQLSMLQHRISL
jgi:hypothetical protein